MSLPTRRRGAARERAPHFATANRRLFPLPLPTTLVVPYALIASIAAVVCMFHRGFTWVGCARARVPFKTARFRAFTSFRLVQLRAA